MTLITIHRDPAFRRVTASIDQSQIAWIGSYFICEGIYPSTTAEFSAQMPFFSKIAAITTFRAGCRSAVSRCVAPDTVSN